MSLVPWLNDLFYERRWPALYDQNFGLGISSLDLATPSLFSVPLRSGYFRPWRLMATNDSGVSNVVNDKDSFKVNLDVQQFKPDEVTVKVADGYLVVEGKHEERGDEHGTISRQFIRRYRLPNNVDESAITSTLSSDGVLQLVAPKKQSDESSEKIIPITQTNQPAIKPKESETKSEEMDS